uniref:Uncharacterized protein n=1 Tax=Anopheles maculatus TaxID=74869 RepID=A0A182SIL3_9DIPT
MMMMVSAGGKFIRTSPGTLLLIFLLLTHRQASADGGGLFDNFISQLMTTAATAQNFIEDAYDQRQGRGTEPPPPLAPAPSSDSLSPVLIPVGSIEPVEQPTTPPSTTTFSAGTTSTTTATHGTRAPLPFWNPFVWLRPKEATPPYNPDTDLSTVSKH